MPYPLGHPYAFCQSLFPEEEHKGAPCTCFKKPTPTETAESSVSSDVAVTVIVFLSLNGDLVVFVYTCGVFVHVRDK
jgi:hypothetical protein